MTDMVNFLKNNEKATHFGRGKNAVPFAVGKWLNARGINCAQNNCDKHNYEM